MKSTQAIPSSSIPTGGLLTFGGGTEYLLFVTSSWHKNLQQLQQHLEVSSEDIKGMFLRHGSYRK